MRYNFLPLVRWPKRLALAVSLLAATALALSTQAQSNGVLREIWFNIPGSAVSDLTGNPAFPANPSAEDFLTAGFETPTNVYDSFGQRLRALLIPPTTGSYVFYIASDDASQLYLSTNATPAGKRLIAMVSGWTDPRQYLNNSEQKSPTITLTAGQQYYVEVLVKEGGGGDNLAVTWRKPGEAAPVAGAAPIPNGNLVIWGLGRPVFTAQPVTSSGTERGTATFSVQLDRPLGAALQWFRNGTNIPGATNATCIIAPLRMADNGSVFYCRASNASGSTNSASAVLNVSADATRPTISYVLNFGDLTSVTVGFSEPVDPTTAAFAGNYFINNGISVLSAILIDESTVLLRTSSLAPSSNYLVTISNIRDTAQTPNTILPSSQRSFSTAITPLDVSYVIGTNEPAGPSSRRTGLAISEIMYHPAPRTDGRNLEFIEIYNSNPWAEDLGGHRISGDVDYAFPAGTSIPALGYRVIAANPADMQAVYGLANVLGPMTNAGIDNVLPNGGGTIWLRDELDTVLLEVFYADDPPWPAAPDGTGHSLVLARASFGEADFRAWAASDRIGGSPGTADTATANPWRTVLFNEVLAHTDPPNEDFLELYNYGASAVNLENCVLTDDPETNKFRIALGTTIAARGHVAFTTSQLGFALSSAGEAVYLISSDGTRVIDSFRFGAQENGVSLGRFPDGTPRVARLQNPTPGTANAPRLASALVINEVMYHPPLGHENDEFVEIYNRGFTAMEVGNWRLGGGISYTFPAGTVIPADDYLVVAQDADNLLSVHPGLSPARVFGNFGGKLSNSGDTVTLEKPDQVISQSETGQWITNMLHIVVDEVTYGTGGRWGRWSDGGGSSLERRDIRKDANFATSWADSDESAKSDWVTVEFTGLLDHGGMTGADQLQLFLLGQGECLVDEVEVLPAGGGNVVNNGNFSTGLGGWFVQGTHEDSHWQATGGYSGGCLHVIATDRGDPGANRIRTVLAQTVPTDATATLRAKVKWLRGHPEILLRLRGNWLEASGIILQTRNLGTPGQRNTQYQTNAGPAVADVRHAPVLPASGQSVLVTARIDDPDGLSLAVLKYRVDPATNYTSIPMTYHGAGLYGGVLPGQTAGRLVAFFVEAANQSFPTTKVTSPWDAPSRECLVRFGESVASGNFGDYRLWLTQTNVDRWANRPKQSNRALDATFVYGGARVCYNMGALYSGSPFHTPGYDTPLGNACDYEVNFAKDEPLLGVTDFVLGTIGNMNSDPTYQAERTAFWIGREIGAPYLHRRYIRLFFNGQLRSQVYEDCQQPNSDVVHEVFPDDPDGNLYKIEDWFEFDDSGDHMLGNVDATLQSFTTTGAVKKTGRYRWNWRPRATGAMPSDFSPLFALVDAANAPQPEPFRSHLSGLADIEQMMRVLALERVVGNWDSYGYARGKNMFAYKPQEGRWTLLPWDIDFVLSSGGNSATDPLFGSNEPILDSLRAFPEFQRAYWRAFEAMANGPLLPANLSAQLDSRYAALVAHGITPESPQTIKEYAAQRRTYILSQLEGVNSPFSVLPSVTVSNGLGVLTGTAPIAVSTLRINGAEWSVRWTSVNNWFALVPLQTGSNFFSVVGLDITGATITGASNTVSLNYAGTPPSPVGIVVLNEIMAHPALPEEEFVELFNTSSTSAFDLSGWVLNGLGYTFPNGAVIQPRDFIVLARDRATFAKAYGPNLLVFDDYSGGLQADGETLSLLQPGTGSGSQIVVDRVRYEAEAPWPLADPGASLQLRDSAQDNSRVANWEIDEPGPQWTYVSNTGNATSSKIYIYLQNSGDVYIDDLQLVAGSVPSSGVNLLTNGGFESSLNGSWSVTSDFSQSALSTTIKRSGQSSLHLVASAAGTGNSDSIYQDVSPTLNSGQPYSLSFWYRSGSSNALLTVRLSGSSPGITLDPTPSADNSGRPATPGRTNSVSATLPVFPSLWLNEAQPVNISGPVDNLGERDPWIELFNPGNSAFPLGGYYLSPSYTNFTQWAFPSNAVVPAGGFLVIWCDDQTNQTTSDSLHANFLLTAGTGQVALSRSLGDGIQLVDYLTYDELPSNWSYGDFPDGQPFYRRQMFAPSPNATNNNASQPISVFINEWMADNELTLADPADNAYEDWFELYNAGTTSVDLGGCYLADSLTNRTQFKVPENGHYVIPPGGFLLVWADNETGQNNTNRQDLHTSFALSKNGETLAVFAADGTQIDAVTFGAQDTDVSEGRFRDGGANIYRMPRPTPRAANIVPNTAPILDPINDIELTLGQSLTFTVTAQDFDVPDQALRFRLGPDAPPGASIDPVSGTFHWTPSSASGPVAITIIVEDDGLPSLSDAQAFQVTVFPPPTIFLQMSEGQARLIWPRGTLQQADEVTGPYSDLTDVSPYTLTPTEARKFYRIRL